MGQVKGQNLGTPGLPAIKQADLSDKSLLQLNSVLNQIWTKVVYLAGGSGTIKVPNDFVAQTISLPGQTVPPTDPNQVLTLGSALALFSPANSRTSLVTGAFQTSATSVLPAQPLPYTASGTSPVTASSFFVNGASSITAAVPLTSQGIPSSSQPLPAATPQVAVLPGPSSPLSVNGQHVLLNGVPYIFTPGLSGPPGYWAIDVTGSPLIRDTFANLSLYPAGNYAIGTVFYATDRQVSYAVQFPGGVATWIYYNGIYENTLSNIPNDLGLTSAGFIFRASDYLHNWLWTGTAWSLTAAAQIGFQGGTFPGTMIFSLGGPPFGGSGALWQLCDGSTVDVSQEDATLVATTVPTIANTWFVR